VACTNVGGHIPTNTNCSARCSAISWASTVFACALLAVRAKLHADRPRLPANRHGRRLIFRFLKPWLAGSSPPHAAHLLAVLVIGSQARAKVHSMIVLIQQVILVLKLTFALFPGFSSPENFDAKDGRTCKLARGRKSGLREFRPSFFSSTPNFSGSSSAINLLPPPFLCPGSRMCETFLRANEQVEKRNRKLPKSNVPDGSRDYCRRDFSYYSRQQRPVVVGGYRTKPNN